MLCDFFFVFSSFSLIPKDFPTCNKKKAKTTTYCTQIVGFKMIFQTRQYNKTLRKKTKQKEKRIIKLFSSSYLLLLLAFHLVYYMFFLYF
jgi:hypothetical protein